MRNKMQEKTAKYTREMGKFARKRESSRKYALFSEFLFRKINYERKNAKIEIAKFVFNNWIAYLANLLSSFLRSIFFIYLLKCMKNMEMHAICVVGKKYAKAKAIAYKKWLCLWPSEITSNCVYDTDRWAFRLIHLVLTNRKYL